MNDSVLGLLCFSLLTACGGQSLDGRDAPEAGLGGAPPAASVAPPTPLAPALPAEPDENELCLYEACGDGTLAPQSDACGMAAQATERCRLDSKLSIGETHLRDASGDGVFSPGEVVHIETGLRNGSRCDQPSLPGISLQSSYPGVPNESGYMGMLWNYVMRGGEVWSDSADIVIPASAAPGTRIEFWLTPRSDFHTDCGKRRVISIVVGAK